MFSPKFLVVVFLFAFFTLVCLWCGWTGGRADVRSRDNLNFSDA